MPTALLDTNAVSNLLKQVPVTIGHALSHPDPVHTSVIVRGEIRYGLEKMPKGKKRTNLQANADSFFLSTICQPVNDEIAEVYGPLKYAQQRSGLTLDDNDLWIAATALKYGFLLVTNDQAFSQVPGLAIVDWSV